jgi:hypothetical protein
MSTFYHPPNDPFPAFIRFHSLRLPPISPTTLSTALPLAFPALPNARDTDWNDKRDRNQIRNTKARENIVSM